MAATDAKILDGGSWKAVEKIWIMDSGVWKPVFKTNLLENPWKEGFKLKGSQMVLSSATIYTSNATYTVPQGVRFVKATVRGAGGGGGGGAPYYVQCAPNQQCFYQYYSGVGGDGGNGGGATSDVYEVRPGNVLTIVVGQGGGAGSYSLSLHGPGNIGGSAGGSGGPSYVSIGANAPNGVSTGTKIAEGLGGGGGQTNMASGSGGSGSFNNNNTQGEGTGSYLTGASGGQNALIQYNYPNYVDQYPTAGGNGSVELYTYSLNNIS